MRSTRNHQWNINMEGVKVLIIKICSKKEPQIIILFFSFTSSEPCLPLDLHFHKGINQMMIQSNHGVIEMIGQDQQTSQVMTQSNHGIQF